MQLWRLEYERDGINLGSWHLCILIRMFLLSYTEVVCEVVCCMAVKLGH